MAKAKTGGTYAIDLKIDFRTFATEAQLRGYNPKDRSIEKHKTFNGFEIKTTNGVECAIIVYENPEPTITLDPNFGLPISSKNKFVVGYRVSFGSKVDQNKKQLLIDEITNKGLYIFLERSKSNTDRIFVRAEDDLLTGFWKLAECVEDIDEIFKHPGGARKSININPENYARASAEVIHIAYKYGMPDLLGRGADIFDNHRVKKLITKGYSEDGKRQSSLTEKNPYCEHVVPCTVIEKMAIEMYKNNQSIEDVASMIKENLFVAYISDDEAKKLDVELNLRMSMPLGWEPGHDPLARLSFAGIELSDYTEPIQKYDFHNSEIFNELFEVQ
jgi:hypothetical protein